MSRLYPFAALLILIVASLHLAVSFMNGFAGNTLIHSALFVIYCVMAWLVFTRSRLTAWLSFFLMLFGGIVAMSTTLANMPEPSPLHTGVWGASWLAALCLFIILWKDDYPAPKAQAQPEQNIRQPPKIDDKPAQKPQPKQNVKQPPKIDDKPAQKPQPQPQQNVRQAPKI